MQGLWIHWHLTHFNQVRVHIGRYNGRKWYHCARIGSAVYKVHTWCLQAECQLINNFMNISHLLFAACVGSLGSRSIPIASLAKCYEKHKSGYWNIKNQRKHEQQHEFMSTSNGNVSNTRRQWPNNQHLNESDEVNCIVYYESESTQCLWYALLVSKYLQYR